MKCDRQTINPDKEDMITLYTLNKSIIIIIIIIIIIKYRAYRRIEKEQDGFMT